MEVLLAALYAMLLILFLGGDGSNSNRSSNTKQAQTAQINRAANSQPTAVPEPPGAGIVFAGAGITMIVLRKCQKRKNKISP